VRIVFLLFTAHHQFGRRNRHFEYFVARVAIVHGAVLGIFPEKLGPLCELNGFSQRGRKSGDKWLIRRPKRGWRGSFNVPSMTGENPVS
jgi:hypothetical protein